MHGSPNLRRVVDLTLSPNPILPTVVYPTVNSVATPLVSSGRNTNHPSLPSLPSLPIPPRRRAFRPMLTLWCDNLFTPGHYYK